MPHLYHCWWGTVNSNMILLSKGKNFCRCDTTASLLVALAVPISCGIYHRKQVLTLLFPWCFSGLLMWQLREDMSVSALTRCHSRPHHKEHPHRNPLQRRGQQAATFQDRVHHFVLKGNQHKDEHCVKHCEPGSREAKRHLGDPEERDGVKLCKKATRHENYGECQCIPTQFSKCFCAYDCACECVYFGLDIALAPPGGQKQTMKWKIFIQLTVKKTHSQINLLSVNKLDIWLFIYLLK